MLKINNFLGFSVDASEAGAGNLEVVVRCAVNGHRIPNFLEASDHSGRFRIYFTPQHRCHRYEVNITFNGEQVDGKIDLYIHKCMMGCMGD